MKLLENIVRTYCQALKDNDYQTIIRLFAKEAKIISFIAGEKSPLDFFQNLFSNSRRIKVEIKNILFDVDNKKIVAAYIYLEVIWNKQEVIQFEVVDIFEFDQENKIKNLKIILDTYPLRKLKERTAAID
jgi:limonene-1,2-epoxide hydrolase